MAETAQSESGISARVLYDYLDTRMEKRLQMQGYYVWHESCKFWEVQFDCQCGLDVEIVQKALEQLLQLPDMLLHLLARANWESRREEYMWA